MREGTVFVAATANDLSSIPPELLRKGRFDEVFFIDLQDIAARPQWTSERVWQEFPFLRPR